MFSLLRLAVVLAWPFLATAPPHTGATRTHRYFRDTFEGSSLALDWSVLHGELGTVGVAGGQCVLTPTVAGPSATWFNDDEGLFVYRTVSGDFTVHARVHASDLAGGAPPPTDYRLGGLLVRQPGTASGNRNSAHVAVGAGTGATPVAAEDKTTVGSVSDFVLHPISASPTADGELRMRRRGNVISLFYRPIGSGAWQLLRAHDHPEFPDTLQVGMMAYSNGVPALIRVAFDEIVFGP